MKSHFTTRLRKGYLLKPHTFGVAIAFISQMMVIDVWADVEKYKRPAQVLEWATLASRKEFEQSHNKKWEEASTKERKDFLNSIQGRPSQVSSQSVKKPRVVWLLSQPALKPQGSKIQFSRRFSLGFKPDFSRRNILTKNFAHRVFVVRR